MMTECYQTHPPRSLTDHSAVTSKFKIENTVQGPGVFRAMPGIEKDPVYDAEVRNLIQKTVLENSRLSEEEKGEETRRGESILELEMKIISNTITDWEKEALAIQLSLQKTQESIIEQEGNTTSSALLNFTLHKLGAHTKIYQRNLKKAQHNSVNELKNKLNEKRDDPDTTEEEIMEIEKNVDELHLEGASKLLEY